MWNNRQSQLMLIRLSQRKIRRLVIPIPLFVLDLTLAAFSDLAHMGDSVISRWICKGNRSNHSTPRQSRVPVGVLFELGLQLLRELRKHGRWRVVEVQHGRVRISIDYY